MSLQYTPRITSRPGKIRNSIREYRLRAGLSQPGLAKLLGRTKKAVSAWERGHAIPELRMLIRLTNALGTSIQTIYHDLFVGESERGNHEPPRA